MTQEETDIKRLRKETGLDIVKVAYKDGKFLLGQQENPLHLPILIHLHGLVKGM